jgi:hypothetical protein
VPLPSRILSALSVLLLLAALAATAAAGGCAGPDVSMTDASADPGAVRAWFDAHREHPRAILLLSPA